MMTSKRKETCGAILRSHIVMCHTLLPADLSRPRNLTSLSGLVLTTSSSQVTNHSERPEWLRHHDVLLIN